MMIAKKISYKLSNENLKKLENLSLEEQISLVNQCIFEDSKINHTKRLKYQYELLKISESNKSNFQSAYILNLIAQTNTQLGDLKSALDNLLNAEKKWKKITDKKYIKSAHPMSLNGMLLCLADIGNVYMKMGLFDQAMKYFENGLKDTNKDDDCFVPYFKLHYHLSEIYMELNFDTKAKQMINRCIKRVESFPFSDNTRSYIYLIPSNMVLAALYMKKGNYQESIDIYNKTLSMCGKFNDVIYKQQILIEIGKINIKLSDFNKAEKTFKKAESMHKKIGSELKLITIKKYLSQILIALNKYEEAKNILSEAKKIAEKNNQELHLIDIYRDLSEVYENLSNPKDSFKYNKMHAKLISDYYINKNKVLINENRKTITDLSNAIKEKHQIETLKDIEMNKKFQIKNQTTKALYRIKENNILESLKEDINKINIKADNTIKKHTKSMLNKISFYNQDKSTWTDFEKMFIQIHTDFIDNLKLINPNLSMKQIRFCMFIKMGMDKYDICNLLNVTTRAVEQQRYRIKKILCPTKNLDQFIQQL
tara:strand:- start:1273 stop:2886 length:1614 start_codon:yes stop_codon:yes gene_type:complete